MRPWRATVASVSLAARAGRDCRVRANSHTQATTSATTSQAESAWIRATDSMSAPLRGAEASPACGPAPVTTVPSTIETIDAAKVATTSQRAPGATGVGATR